MIRYLTIKIMRIFSNKKISYSFKITYLIFFFIFVYWIKVKLNIDLVKGFGISKYPPFSWLI
jgi:hypothetical protein